MLSSAYPWWWLALPVLLLPVWWHRQKRQRPTAEPLATARFLPAAAPEQIRVWRWRDRTLLLVRCLLLVALIAWLAATIFPWRGHTVLVDAGADPAWVAQQVAAAGMTDAQRLPLPPDALHWLRAHEGDWRDDARLLIVARAGHIGMTARAPQFSHPVELRVQPAPAIAATVVAVNALARYPVVLAASPERSGAWRALFAAFDRAGSGTQRRTVATAPSAGTELIVWDTPGEAPPAQWHAPHWWIGAGATLPATGKSATLKVDDITLQYVDSARGRLWTSDAFPPRDAGTARALYEAWRLLDAAPAPAYPAPSHTFAAARPAAMEDQTAQPGQSARWMALALLALFLLERILTHARRH
ncbi:MAG: BatA domain-containing protein [Duganella sp.]